MSETDYAIMLKMAIHYANKDILAALRRDCLNVAANFILNSKDEDEFLEFCKWWKEGIREIERDYMRENGLYFDLQNRVIELSNDKFDREFPALILLRDILWPP